MYRVGLTGGIASGKTTVADLFAQHGIPIIDADLIAADLVKPGTPHLHIITETFGDEFLNADQSLNRAALAKRIFTHPQSRRQLEAILHPAVRKEINRQINALDGCYCIVCIPLLVETSQQNQFDEILVTDCSEATQIQRLIARENITKDYAQQMLATQVTREKRLLYADEVLNTECSLTELATAVTKLDEKYRRICENTGG